jgi:hypothetical protein
MNDELERIWMGVAMAYFKILSPFDNLRQPQNTSVPVDLRAEI